MENLEENDHLRDFLRGKGIEVRPFVAASIVRVLKARGSAEEQPLYPLYKGETRICGIGTVYKVRKLYDSGELDPGIDVLSGG